MDFASGFYCLKRDLRNARTEEREEVVCKFPITKVISSNDLLYRSREEEQERDQVDQKLQVVTRSIG